MYLLLFLLFFSLPVFSEVIKSEEVDYSEKEQVQDLNQEQDEDKSIETQMRQISASNYLGFITDIVGLHWIVNAPDKMKPDSFDLTNICTTLLRSRQQIYYGMRINKSRIAFCPGIGRESVCYVFPRVDKIYYSLNRKGQDEVSITKASQLVLGRGIKDEEVSRSILEVTYLSCLLEMRFNADPVDAKEKFFIGGGIRLLVRTDTKTTISCKEDNEYKKYNRSESFNLRRLLIGAQLRLGYKRFGIEGKYILNSLFKDNKGPGNHMHPFDISIFVDLI